jgi:hypothetical protein
VSEPVAAKDVVVVVVSVLGGFDPGSVEVEWYASCG